MIKTQKAKQLRALLKKHWEKGLKSYGVAYPENTAHEPGLLALFEAMPNALSQEQLSAFYDLHSHVPYNKQLRHLASEGWDIRSGNSRFSQGLQDKSLSRNQMRLSQYQSPHARWIESERLKRTGGITKLKWMEKLEEYKHHGCSVCGQKFDNYDQGHLDPEKPYSDENIVPMCPPCNNWAQDRVTFKLYGLIARPIYIKAREKNAN